MQAKSRQQEVMMTANTNVGQMGHLGHFPGIGGYARAHACS